MDKLITLLSASVFTFAAIIPTCPRVNPSVITLICSSFLYKFTYLYYPHMSILLDIITKIDHICIMNIFLAYFDKMSDWKKMAVHILTLVHHRFMHFFFIYFMCVLLVDFIVYEYYFLLFFFLIATCSGLLAYFDYVEKGWTKFNSWLWHYASLCIILCVKLCDR